MADKLVGILGLGNIGRQVARRVQGFEARVQYYDLVPVWRLNSKAELGVTRVGIRELFETSDIISVHTPLTPGTRHIVSSELIGLDEADCHVGQHQPGAYGG